MSPIYLHVSVPYVVLFRLFLLPSHLTPCITKGGGVFLLHFSPLPHLLLGRREGQNLHSECPILARAMFDLWLIFFNFSRGKCATRQNLKILENNEGKGASPLRLSPVFYGKGGVGVYSLLEEEMRRKRREVVVMV